MSENDIKNNIETTEAIKLQRVDKVKSRCSSCHRLRVIKNKELNLCSICDSAKKYWCDKNKNDTIINDNKYIDTKIKTENEVETEVEKVTFYCDVCNNKVIYGQRQCHKCNTLLNWLNTDLENDDNYLICGNCGIILDKNSTICLNCNGVAY